MPHAGIADVRLGHLVAGVEAVDLLHQVEHHPEHVEVIAAGDEAGMRHRCACQRARAPRSRAASSCRSSARGWSGRPPQAPSDARRRAAAPRCSDVPPVSGSHVGDRGPDALLSHPALQVQPGRRRSVSAAAARRRACRHGVRPLRAVSSRYSHSMVSEPLEEAVADPRDIRRPVRRRGPHRPRCCGTPRSSARRPLLK